MSTEPNLLCRMCGDVYCNHLEEQCLFQPSVFKAEVCPLCGAELLRVYWLRSIELPFNIKICYCQVDEFSDENGIPVPAVILYLIANSPYASEELKRRCSPFSDV